MIEVHEVKYIGGPLDGMREQPPKMLPGQPAIRFPHRKRGWCHVYRCNIWTSEDSGGYPAYTLNRYSYTHDGVERVECESIDS